MILQSYECPICGETGTEFDCKKNSKGQLLCPLCGKRMHPQGSPLLNRTSSSNRKKEIYQAARKLADSKRLSYPEAHEKILEHRKEARKSTGRKVRAFGKSKTCRQWVESEICIVKRPGTLYSRVFRYGWDPEKALTTPVGKGQGEQD